MSDSVKISVDGVWYTFEPQRLRISVLVLLKKFTQYKSVSSLTTALQSFTGDDVDAELLQVLVWLIKAQDAAQRGLNPMTEVGKPEDVDFEIGSVEFESEDEESTDPTIPPSGESPNTP